MTGKSEGRVVKGGSSTSADGQQQPAPKVMARKKALAIARRISERDKELLKRLAK